MDDDDSLLEILDHFVDLFNRLEVSLVLHCTDYFSEHSKARWDIMFNHCQKILRKLGDALRWNDAIKPLEVTNEKKKYDSFGRSIGEMKRRKGEPWKAERGKKLEHLLAMRAIAATRGKQLSTHRIDNSNNKSSKLTSTNESLNEGGCNEEYKNMLREFQSKKRQPQIARQPPHRDTSKQKKQFSQNISIKASLAHEKEKPYLDDIWLSTNIRKAASILSKMIIKDAILCFNNPSIVVNTGEIDISKDVSSRCPGYTIFRRMRYFDTFQNAMQIKFANFEEDLIQLIISPRDMFKFLDDTFDCVSETYPKKKLTVVKFREIVSYNRKVRGMSGGKLDKKDFKIVQKSKDKNNVFKSSIHFCSFLLLQAIKGEMEQLSNYIKDLNLLIKNFAKLLYIFLPYHNKGCFAEMINQNRLKLIPRLACLLGVQIFCKTFCDLVSCWQLSGLQDSDRHRLLLFIKDEKLEKIHDSKHLQGFPIRVGRKSDISTLEDSRRSSHSTKAGFSMHSIEKWLKDFIIFLVGMTSQKAGEYDFCLKKMDNKPIVKMKMSLWSVLLDADDDSGSFSMTKEVYIAEGGHLAYDFEKAKQLVEENDKSKKSESEGHENHDSPTESQPRPRKVLFSKHGSRIPKKGTSKKDSPSVGTLSEAQRSTNISKSTERSFIINPRIADDSTFSTTDLAVNLIETLYNKGETTEEEQNTIQVVLPRANISKIQSILAAKGITGFGSTLSRQQDAELQHLVEASTFVPDATNETEEVNQFFHKYWEPKFKDVADQLDTQMAKDEHNGAKSEASSPNILIRPTFGQIILNLDPAIVAKCLVTFSLRDEGENPALGRRLSYRSLLNPDLSIISKFTTVNEKTAEYLEKRRKTSIKVELLPNLNAMLTNKNLEDFQLKMTHNELDELKFMVKEELAKQLADLQTEEDINILQEAQIFNVFSKEPGSMHPTEIMRLEQMIEEDEILISSLNFHGPNILDSIQASTSNLYRVISKATVPKFVESAKEMVKEDVEEDECEAEKDENGMPTFIPSGCGRGSSAIALD